MPAFDYLTANAALLPDHRRRMEILAALAGSTEVPGHVLSGAVASTEDASLGLYLLAWLRAFRVEWQEEHTDPFVPDTGEVIYEGSGADHAEILYNLAALAAGVAP